MQRTTIICIGIHCLLTVVQLNSLHLFISVLLVRTVTRGSGNGPGARLGRAVHPVGQVESVANFVE